METDSEDDEYALPEKPKTVFDEMMAKTKTFKKNVEDLEEEGEDGPHDPGGAYWGIIYMRKLLRPVDPEDPLIGNAYLGQAVRPIGKKYPTALSVAKKRWQEEDCSARAGNGSCANFLELVRIHGPEAFENCILLETRGLKPDLSTWANVHEKAEIASHGGPMRDMEPKVHIKQTFNRTDGGQGEFTINQVASSARAWKKFNDELQIFIVSECTAYVPRTCVNPSGYRLGQAVSSVRDGRMVDGHPERRNWLDSLTGWSWNTVDDNWVKFAAEIELFYSQYKHVRILFNYISASKYPLGQTVSGVRQLRMVKGHPERRKWLDSLNGWTWNAWDAAWEEFRDELVLYVAAFKTALVPQSHKNSSGYALGRVVMTVRAGQMVEKHPDRRIWLDSLPGWVWKGAKEANKRARIEHARCSAIPNCSKKHRVHGLYYLKDGKIWRCEKDLTLKLFASMTDS